MTKLLKIGLRTEMDRRKLAPTSTAISPCIRNGEEDEDEDERRKVMNINGERFSSSRFRPSRRENPYPKIEIQTRPNLKNKKLVHKS